MTIRLKFKLDSIEHSRVIADYAKADDGQVDYSNPIMEEVVTVRMSPVSAVSAPNGANDPAHENTAFWRLTPSGCIYFITVRRDAAAGLVLGREYFIEISEANGAA